MVRWRPSPAAVGLLDYIVFIHLWLMGHSGKITPGLPRQFSFEELNETRRRMYFIGDGHNELGTKK
jgi:hypothetical protein